jgi:hypothetical protein
MDASDFDEAGFFHAVQESGVRALLIGRRALIALGLPLVTGDYDYWMPSADIERFNAAAEPFALYPNCAPDEARRRGRYVLENDTRVDVLLAQRMSGKDGEVLTFEEAWQRRCLESYDPRTNLIIPDIDDLIRTKRWSLRPKDLPDIQMLELLRQQRKRP